MKKILCLMLALLILASFAPYSGAVGSTTLEGVIKSISNDKIVITDYSKNEYSLATDASTTYTIDSRSARLSDFRPGIEVYAVLDGTLIISLEGYSLQKPGYIKPDIISLSGTIRTIDRNQLIIKLSDGSTRTVFTSGSTIVKKDGHNISASTLYVGDSIKAYFEGLDKTTADRIEVQGATILVQNVYRGTLKALSAYGNSLAVTNIDVLRNGSWETYKSSASFNYMDGVPVYLGSKKTTVNDLGNYTGKTVYIAVKNFFGVNRVEKIVIKNANEWTYLEKINNLNWFTGAFELSNNQNVSFGEGSIIVKDGRIVDQYALDAKQNALVVADGYGSTQNADVVLILDEDLNNSNAGQYQLFAGTLDQVLPASVRLKNFYAFTNNSWVSFTDIQELTFDNDTDVYDAVNKKFIKPQEFYTMDYAVDESTDYAINNNLKDWYGYFYTDGRRICAAMLIKNLDSLDKQFSTTGILDSHTDDDAAGRVISLRDSSDWSNGSSKWIARSVPAPINIEKALIIRDGKVIDKDELNTDDKLFIVRDDYVAKLVIVK